MLDYAIVVATRNRLDALKVSVPLFREQSRPPARIVIIDRSDDHAAVAAFGAAAGVEVIEADRANACRQRNIGLDLISEPVVMFPDDDSFWFPDTAERMMEVYERDRNGLIGGVAAAETQSSPVKGREAPPKTHRFVQRGRIRRLRRRFEAFAVPPPFEVYGRRHIAELAPKAFQAGLDESYVPTMGGFQMSFRTELARQLRFDETLGFRVGYALHEDMDISLRALKAGFLHAVAPGARVFHNVHPGRRAAGFAYGFCHTLNRAYICRKVFGRDAPELRLVRLFNRYKTFLYGLRAGDYNRDVARGARAALAEQRRILSASYDEGLADLYREISDRVLPGSGSAGASSAALRGAVCVPVRLAALSRHVGLM